MKTILRLVTVTAVAGTALALAGNALATPTLAVQQSSTSLTIVVKQAQTDQQPAKIQIFVPAGYTVNANQAPGTKIGTTTGDVFARDQNIPLPLQGDVTVADPAQFKTSACSPGTNAAVWLLNLSVAGQTISLPLYVNPTTGAETALGPAKMVVCLAPADTPQGSPGRSPFGAQLLDATFTVNNVITPPSGASRWTSLWTRYAAGTGIPNPASTVEARAFVGPGQITLKARVVNKKKKIVLLRGSVSSGGAGVAGATVRLLINSRLSKITAKTNGSGAYTMPIQKTSLKASTFFFQTRVNVPASDVTSTGCASPSVPPIPCVSATQGAFTALSNKVRVHI